MKLVVAEKPSVAQSLAAVLGAKEKKDGYLEGSGWLVSWCVGHLVELAQPEAYGEQYAKWRYADLPAGSLWGAVRQMAVCGSAHSSRPLEI